MKSNKLMNWIGVGLVVLTAIVLLTSKQKEVEEAKVAMTDKLKVGFV